MRRWLLIGGGVVVSAAVLALREYGLAQAKPSTRYVSESGDPPRYEPMMCDCPRAWLPGGRGLSHTTTCASRGAQ